MVVVYVVIHDEVNNNKDILFTHATSRSNENSLTHVREGKKDTKKRKKKSSIHTKHSQLVTILMYTI